MKRHLYEDDHEAFRGVVREFVRREVESNIDRWEQQRFIDRHTWIAAGKHGIIGLSTPEGYNGAGQIHDYRYRNVVLEEFAAVGATSLSLSFSLQDDIVIPYIAGLGTDEQKQRWLPFMASGEPIDRTRFTPASALPRSTGPQPSTFRSSSPKRHSRKREPMRRSWPLQHGARWS